MITLDQYWMGRDQTHAQYLAPSLEDNARRIVSLTNKLLVEAAASHVPLVASPKTRSFVVSGWRPAPINEVTPGAAPNSLHMTCHAIDVYDPQGSLDDWLLRNEFVLKVLGLWMEHPAATKGWTHLQDLPPPSGNRVFYP